MKMKIKLTGCPVIVSIPATYTMLASRLPGKLMNVYAEDGNLIELMLHLTHATFFEKRLYVPSPCGKGRENSRTGGVGGRGCSTEHDDILSYIPPAILFSSKED
jgi:hypothetical protein